MISSVAVELKWTSVGNFSEIYKSTKQATVIKKIVAEKKNSNYHDLSNPIPSQLI